MPSTISCLLDVRLTRYALAAAAVAAVPAQAAPITVILPTPVDVRNGYPLDIDQNGVTELFFTGAISTVLACWFTPINILVCGSLNIVRGVDTGFTFDLSGSSSFWVSSGTMLALSGTNPTFLGIRFATSQGGFQRVGFAQFYGPNLYGFAWEQASSITTFDLSAAANSAAIPEPATGALSALALGAAALAARKRKQASE
jgi:hypothetical protein